MADSSTDTRQRNVQSKNTDVSKEAKKSRPDKPVHHSNESLLSTESGYNNYRGLLNLCIVLLALSNGRVALENFLKYGILVDPLQWFRILIHDQFHWSFVALFLCTNIFILFSLLLEYAVSKNKISEVTTYWLHLVNLFSILFFPAVIVYFCDTHPVGGSLALGGFSTMFLKLVSYMIVNRWCREAREKKVSDVDSKVNGHVEPSHIVYPGNLNIKDIYYFIFVPTLCYELNFPRSPRIRKRFLIKRFLEMLFISQLMFGLIQQWMVPTIRNSTIPFKEMNYSRLLERLLKLAVPNHLIWLIGFYWFFHSCLNFMAELARFADREFYRDWWNSETVNYFWQNWNIPVHRWCLRHLYMPLTQMGYNRSSATVIVFLISAFFHEYLVSIPLKMFRLWAFIGMAAQVPFARFVRRFLAGKFSNMAVWLSLIIGQPLAILMYYHDYYIIHYENSNEISH
uniref:O-acyltransferase n=1 Tax=Strigamia maritima TaxID=126957 RepID=T1J269_STRMM